MDNRHSEKNLNSSKMRRTLLILGFAFLGIVNCAKAQDVIRFTWQAGTTEKSFSFGATQDQTFTIDWGDGKVEQYTGIGSYTTINHTYAAEGSYDVSITANNHACRFTYFYDNVCSAITFDASGCSALTNLACRQGGRLTSLNVSGCTALQNLDCSSNKLTNLDVSTCTALSYLYCRYNNLTNLDVSNNPELKILLCEGNRLTNLDVNNNTLLSGLFCVGNHLPLSDLFTASEILKNNSTGGTWDRGVFGKQTLPPQTVALGIELEFSVPQNVFNGIYTEFTVTKNGNPAPQSDYSINNGKITFNTSDLFFVTMTNQAIVSDTNTQVTFTIMTTSSQPLFHFDDKEGLRVFLRQPSAVAGKINAEQFDFTISDTLDWYNNEIWVLKVSDKWNEEMPKRMLENNSSWKNNWINNNLAGVLNASKWIKLEKLNCGNNQLTSLDISKNIELTQLHCYNNQLTTLDISKNTKLTELNCSDNLLTKLNVNNNMALGVIEFANNQLTSIDVSGCIILWGINCYGNQLTELNVNNNTALTHLWCWNNKLTELDLSSNAILIELLCNDNQLTTLKVNACTALQNLYCINNRLQLSDLYNFSEMITLQYNKGLGTQNLLPQTIAVNVAYGAGQNVFGGTYTQYSNVLKSDTPATENVDYTVSEGKITFKTKGTYTITMTNEAIISSPHSPAEVIATIIVDEVGVTERSLSNILIYPNPTQNTFIIDCENDKTIKLYDMFGKEVLIQNANGKTEINISHLPNGIYNVSLFSEGKIVGNSKIVKQ